MLLRAVLVSEAVAPPPLVMSVPDLRATLPSRLDHAPIGLRHPSRRGGLGGGLDARLPAGAGRASLRRDPYAQAGGRQRRWRRKRISRRLPRAACIPLSKPRALQAGHGRRLRAR